MRKICFCILLFSMSVMFDTKVSAEYVSLLKDLDVTNGFMIQYDKDTPFYTVELDEGESLPQIIAVPKNEDCTVKIDVAQGDLCWFCLVDTSQGVVVGQSNSDFAYHKSR